MRALERKKPVVQRVLLCLVKQAVAIARKLIGAVRMQINDPTSNGTAGWNHAVLHFLRVYVETTLSEVLDRVEEMKRV